MSKESLLRVSPFDAAGLSVRYWGREDAVRLTAWPAYPAPFDAFNLSCRGLDKPRLQAWFSSRDATPNRITFIADHESEQTIAYLALLDMDWADGIVGNMSFRVKPSWCDLGFGSAIMRSVSEWTFAQGINALRLDVAAANPRAVRCYEKAGFRIAGEFWREDSALAVADLAQPQHVLLRDHVRFDGTTPKVRFWLMEHARQDRIGM